MYDELKTMGREEVKQYSGIHSKTLKKVTKDFSQGSRCSARGSNQVHPEISPN
jgi:hypothetical protein